MSGSGNSTISRIDVFAHSVGYAHGTYVMSGGRAASRQTSTLVRITTAAGMHGWGEITPLGATYLPTFTGVVRSALELLCPHLLGLDAVNVAGVDRVMNQVLLGHPYAKSPIDMACWDVRGRVLGVPISNLLGGVLQEWFPIYEPVPLRSPAEMAEYVTTRRAAGVNRFQLKVGNEPSDDIARAEATAAALDQDSVLVADSNGGWNLAQAQQAVRGMRGLPVLIEQPCRTTADSAAAMRRSDLPLVLDESITTLDDVMTAKNVAGAVAINIKLSRVGGITRARRFRDLVQDLGLLATIEDMWGGDIVSSAVSHLAATTRPEGFLMSPLLNELTSDGFIAGHVPASIDGKAQAPTGPGLGIDVDETQLGAPILSFGG